MGSKKLGTNRFGELVRVTTVGIDLPQRVRQPSIAK